MNGSAWFCSIHSFVTSTARTEAVFQITFKGRVLTRNFEGSIDVDLPTPSQVYHLFCQVRWPAFSGF